MRSFVPGICCAHAWHPLSLSQFKCERCPAKCIRDEHGKIIDYDNDGLIKGRS